jgi:hypothetical protein
MSTDLGDQLPDDLYALLTRGPSQAPSGTAIPICTADADGWPHPALLSANEVSASDRSTLSVVTFGGSTTTRNLRANGKITLIFIDETMIYYVKGIATPGETSSAVAITHVLADAPGPSEQGAKILSGINFQW